MAAFENQYVEIQIGLTADDLEALQAHDKSIKHMANLVADDTVLYCEAQQTVTQDSDGSCGLGSLVNEGASGLKVGFFCEKPVCNDQTICANFAGRTLLHQINSGTQFRRPFRSR